MPRLQNFGGIALEPLILLLILFAALGDKKSQDALGFGCVLMIIDAIIVIYFLFSNLNSAPY